MPIRLYPTAYASLRRLSMLVAALLIAFAAAQTDRTPIEEGYIPIGDGAALYYQKHGEGPPELIVTNHIAAAVPLSGLAHDRTVVFYDTRGRGHSTTITDPARFGMEQEIADLGRVQDHFGVERSAILGWSLWGGFVQLYAARHPERVSRVVALGPIQPAADPYSSFATLAPDPDFEAFDAFMATVAEDTPPFELCMQQYAILLSEQLSDEAFLEPANRKACTVENERDANVIGSIVAIFESMGDWDWMDEIATVDVPVMIVHGDYDTVAPEAIDAYLETLPDAGAVVIEDAGHMGFVERPARYVEIVDAFLAGAWPEEARRP